jgi:hypothetical protein
MLKRVAGECYIVSLEDGFRRDPQPGGALNRPGLQRPPMLLGIPGDNTYANYAEANFSF